LQNACEIIPHSSQAKGALKVRLKIWINAFIPRTVSGYTIVIPRGKHAAKTAVPLTGLARMNPLNTFKNLDSGCLTDQRGFESSPFAGVRMQSMAEIELSPPSLVATVHRSSGTTEVDTDTGDQLGFKVADMSRCSFSDFTVASTTAPGPTSPLIRPPLSPSASPVVITIQVKGQASDPLVSAAADIDYEGKSTISFVPGINRVMVQFIGLIDAFPAFECYASLNGVTKALFNIPPPAGNTVTDLLCPLHNSCRFSSPNGWVNSPPRVTKITVLHKRTTDGLTVERPVFQLRHGDHGRTFEGEFAG
jgi:hypothetical protein